jgi:hypothetical protein
MGLGVCLLIAFIGLCWLIKGDDGSISFDDGEGCLGFSIVVIIIALALFTCSNYRLNNNFDTPIT